MLIFDQFPSHEKAADFAREVTRLYNRTATVCKSQEEALKLDVFPFDVEPPIVVVERMFPPMGASKDAWRDAWVVEDAIEELVTKYGGLFAGT